MNKVNQPLEFIKEENSAVFFFNPITGQTLDIPKHYRVTYETSIKEFTIESHGEYYFEYDDKLESVIFAGKCEDKVILITLSEDNVGNYAIDDVSIYRLKQKAH